MSDDMKPWEKNGEPFDEATAWQLIQNLRAEVKAEKAAHQETRSERDSLAGERDSLAAATQERDASLESLRGELQARESDLSQAQSLRSKEHLLADKGLPLRFASRLPDDEEELTAAVEDLVSLRGDQVGTSVPPNPAQVADDAGQSTTDAARNFFGLN